MKIFWTLAILVTSNTFSSAQGIFNNSELGLSLPLIHNKYEVTNVYGPKRQISGLGWSRGINFSFTKYFKKNIFLFVGFGYFKQSFFLHRPFDYPSPTFPLFTTKEYFYQNIQMSVGVGYNLKIGKFYIVKSSISYNKFDTFKQEFYTETNDPKYERKRYYNFGSAAILSFGIFRKINPKTQIGINLLLPMEVKWRKDSIFEENSTEFYSPKSSSGFSFSFLYQI